MARARPHYLVWRMFGRESANTSFESMRWLIKGIGKNQALGSASPLARRTKAVVE